MTNEHDTNLQHEIRALTNSGHATVAAVSPDGRYVVYVNRENGKSELRMLQSSTGRDVVILPGTAEIIAAPQFSPDGERISFKMSLARSSSFKFATPVFLADRSRI